MAAPILLSFLQKSNFLIIVLILSVFLGITLTGLLNSIFSRSISATYIEIEKGDSLYKIIDELPLNYFDNLILKFFYSTKSNKNIYVGIYDVTGKNLKQYLEAILTGDLKQFKFQIIEGENIFDLKEKIANLGIKNDCVDFDCLEDNLFPFVEGTFFPDTYFLTSNDSLKKVLLNSQLRLLRLLESLWNSNQSYLDNKHDALILASIIEKEAGNKYEMPIIASVFHNRIKAGMKLQTDPTIIYGLLPNFDGDIKRKDILDNTNIFNTYVISGLPPTPIAMISESALLAVFQPKDTQYYYFVAKGNGEHYFSATLKEHEAAVRRYQLQ